VHLNTGKELNWRVFLLPPNLNGQASTIVVAPSKIVRITDCKENLFILFASDTSQLKRRGFSPCRILSRRPRICFQQRLFHQDSIQSPAAIRAQTPPSTSSAKKAPLKDRAFALSVGRHRILRRWCVDGRFGGRYGTFGKTIQGSVSRPELSWARRSGHSQVFLVIGRGNRSNRTWRMNQRFSEREFLPPRDWPHERPSPKQYANDCFLRSAITSKSPARIDPWAIERLTRDLERKYVDEGLALHQTWKAKDHQ